MHTKIYGKAFMYQNYRVKLNRLQMTVILTFRENCKCYYKYSICNKPDFAEDITLDRTPLRKIQGFNVYIMTFPINF